jgi:hypothetical protein
MLMAALLCIAGLPWALEGQAPWASFDAQFERDDQVLTSTRVTVEHGRYLSSDLTLAARLEAHRITLEEGSAVPAIRAGSDRTAIAGLEGTLGVAPARLGIRLAAGVLLGAPEPDGESRALTPVHDLALGWSVGRGTQLRVRNTRDRYTATAASVDTLVLRRSTELRIDRSGDPGWAGEVSVSEVRFGGANRVVSAFGWFLAPLSRSLGHSIRGGYAISRADSREARWVEANPESTDDGPDGHVPGRYAPYYTPLDQLTHSVLMNMAVSFEGAWLLLDGAVGVRATETVPELFRAGEGEQRSLSLHFHERSFSPFRASLSLSFPIADHSSFIASIAHRRTAYYRTGSIHISFVRSL